MTQMSEGETVWRPSSNVVMRRIVDETILVPVSGNLADMQRIFSLNEVGTTIWKLLDGKRTATDIRKAIHREFDVEAHRLEKDVNDFLDSLLLAGLVSESS